MGKRRRWLRHLLGRLPRNPTRDASAAPAPEPVTRLRAIIEAQTGQHPGKSGVIKLRSGRDAFASRVLLADAAERTLDLQYYIWRNDMSGSLLAEAVRRAADRGVRVRILIDDNNTAGLDPLLAGFDAHPNIEVRLFNPSVYRRFRWLGLFTDFARLNRRMHNKSFTVDGLVTIVGGRNLSDEYFDASDSLAFVDLDVMAVGPVVADVARSFEEYWNCESAYPAAEVLGRISAAAVRRMEKMHAAAVSHPRAVAYGEALSQCGFVRELLAGTLQLHWAPTRMLVDHPAKALDRAPSRDMLPERLKAALATPRREIHLVTPYLVPTAAGVVMLDALVDAGVSVTILTNALEATDVALVHAGYAKRRGDLLSGGTCLYELRRQRPRPSRRERRLRRDRRLTGSSASSLHAKTFAVDGERVFIGSLNFDPRSASLNTEIGFLIDSPEFALELKQWFAEQVPVRAYRVELDERRRLRWIERHGAVDTVHEREPGTTAWQRLLVSLLSRLPIERLL